MHSSEKSAVEYMETLKEKIELFMKVGHTSDSFDRDEIEEQNQEAIRLIRGGMGMSAAARELGLKPSSLRSRFRRNPSLFELTKVDSSNTNKNQSNSGLV